MVSMVLDLRRSAVHPFEALVLKTREPEERLETRVYGLKVF